MMKVVQINTFSNKSTGTIMLDIHEALKKNNIESYVVWGRGRKARDEGEIYLKIELDSEEDDTVGDIYCCYDPAAKRFKEIKKNDEEMFYCMLD